MSERIENSTAHLLNSVRNHVDALAEEGVVDPANVKWKIAKAEDRKAIVARRTAEGASQRQIAEELGVGLGTVNRDLAVPNGTKNVPNGTTEPEPIPAPSSAGRFETIVIDPPWPMTKIERDVRPNQAEFDYRTMDERELQEFGTRVEAIAGDNCHIFMWTTQRFLPVALQLIDLYGFRYVLTMVWHKAGGYQPIKLPQFNCEFVVYGRKGTPEFVDTKGFPCCFNAPRREHSRKPDEFYDIVNLVTKGPRIDVFSREPREGFEQFGNEPDRFGGGR